MNTAVIGLRVTDDEDRPLANAVVLVCGMGLPVHTERSVTDGDGAVEILCGLDGIANGPRPLLLTVSLRGYQVETTEIALVDDMREYNEQVRLKPVTVPGFPCTDLRFEGICLTAQELIAHPNTCRLRDEYLMLYTLKSKGVWGTAAATSKDGLCWEEQGFVLTPQTIDPDGTLGVQNLYTAQPLVDQGALYVLAGAKRPTDDPTIAEHHLWLFKNTGDVLDPTCWEVVNNRCLMGRDELWGSDPQDARIYVLKDPPVVDGRRDKFWMAVIANPKTRSNVEAQRTMMFSSEHIEGPYRYRKTVIATPSWFHAEWPGSIIRVGTRYFWLSTQAETCALHGEFAKGVLYYSDDFLSWQQLSSTPLIAPQPYPAFDDIFTGEFEFQAAPDHERVFIYYAARSLDQGKQTIACYSLKVDGAMDLLKGGEG